MDPALLKQLAAGAIPPLVFGALLFGLGWRRREAEPSPAFRNPGLLDDSRLALDGPARAGTPWRTWLVVLACGVMPALMYRVISGAWPVFPPVRAEHFVPVIAGIFALTGVVSLLARHPAVLFWTAGIAMGVLGILLVQRATQQWPNSQARVNLFAFASLGMVGLMGCWFISRVRGVVGIATLAIVAIGASQVLAASLSSLKTAQYAGVLGALLAPGVVVALFRPAFVMPAAGAVLTAAWLALLLRQGAVLGEARIPAALACGAVAIAPWLALLGVRLTRRGGLAMVLVPLVFASLPIAGVVAWSGAVVMRAESAREAGGSQDEVIDYGY